MRCDKKKFSVRYASVKFVELKFVSQSFDHIEGHWECEKHAIMFGCLCNAPLREEGATHLHTEKTIN